MTLVDQVGVEKFRHRTEEILAAQPLFACLGARVISLGEGRCEIALRLREELLNDRGTLQATVLYAMLHAATFVASRTLARDRAEMDFHQEMKINFIKALGDPRQTITARGRALHRGRRSAVVEGEVCSETGELIAKALGTIAVLGAGEPPNRGSEIT
ncbi:MAG TPA: PaaI family thioesterase [Syntrophobacteria bacterium]|nr:PaaI family thioesterase [Syntrophobacteria bacterium]